jgi:hypothetical protein
LAVLHALRIPIVPPVMERIMRLPEPLMVPIMRRRLTAPGVRVGAVHIDKMGPELTYLAGQYRELMRRASLSTPNMERLLAALSPSVPPIPLGSAGLKLDWRGMYAVVAALSALVALLFGLTRRKRTADRRRTTDDGRRMTADR